MTSILARLAAAVVVFLMAAAVRPTVAAVFNPQTFTLANGMQVVVIPNHRTPVVTHMVWYKAGAADEPPGQSGVAHLLEHLMFKGTKQSPAGEFSRIVARHGGEENAFTGSDYTAYFQTVARDRLPTVMALEADRMTNLLLADDQVATERQVVLEERRQRVDNEPAAVLGEHVDAALYLNHPYRRPIIGWEHEIVGLSRDDVLGFYRQWYAPNNAILVVAGDITAEELKPLAERYYGGIPAAATPPRTALAEPPHQAPRQITLKDPKVQQPEWNRTYLAPSAVTAAGQEAYALEIADIILGGGPTSRLYRKLVVDDRLAVGAGSGYRASARGPATFRVYASPRPGVDLDTLEKGVDAVLREIVAGGVSADEVSLAKKQVLADAVYMRDSQRAGAYALGEALAIGLSVDDVENMPERIAAVTPEMVNAALTEVLDARRSVTARLLPGEADVVAKQ